MSEVARLMAVSERTVRRLIDRGEIAAERIGATLAVIPSALPEPLAASVEAGNAEPLLTIHDAARMLECSPMLVRRLTSQGKLREIWIGSAPRWSPNEVADFLRSAEEKLPF